jgi:RNA polymerase sigma factor (sigma-70 family)
MDVEDAFRVHHRALYRFLARECGNSQLARDAVQETFLRLQMHPPAVDRALRPWLFTTGLNVIRDVTRTAASRARLLESKAAKVPQPKRFEGPDERLERLEDGARLRRALAELRPRERVALLMREEGFKHREIADVLGTTTGSIGTLLSRALEKMAASMRQEGGGA